MDDFRRDIQAALEAEWRREPPADLGVRAVSYAVGFDRSLPGRHRLPLAFATAAAILLAVVAAGTLVTFGRSSQHRALPAASAAPAPSNAPTPAPSSAPTPTPAPAFAVQNAGTVMIVGTTGTVLASASFDPPKPPLIGNAQAFIQSPVRVAAGSVFYADAHGVVRRLDRDGRVTTVATFPVASSQQELSFAVSPDGRRLMASILTAPPVRDPPPKTPVDPVFVDGGRWSLELFTADAGGPAVSTYRRDLGQQPGAPTIVVGWDQTGPVATLNTQIGGQGLAPFSDHFYGEALIHIADDGTHLEQVGGDGCKPLDELPDGTVLCYTGSAAQQIEVRRASGEQVWRASGEQLWRQDPGGAYPITFHPHLSPDGSRIATGTFVLSRDGPRVTLLPTAPLNDQHVAEGWLDDRTVVVAWGPLSSKLGLVSVDSPGQLRELPVQGTFIGVL